MPNWKNKIEYDFTTSLDRRGWAWEFLRRNEDYKSDFLASLLPKTYYLPPKTASESETQWQHRVIEQDLMPEKLAASVYFARKWGIRGVLCDPNGHSKPEFTVKFPSIPSWDQLPAYFDEFDGGARELQPGIALVLFDLTAPLTQQFTAAQHMLAQQQDGLSKQTKKSVLNKYGLYLRLLDASAAGATTEEIRVGIEEYSAMPQVLDGKSVAKDRISDHRKSAIQLLNNPLSLLATTGISPK